MSRKGSTARSCKAPDCTQIHRYLDGYCHLHRKLAAAAQSVEAEVSKIEGQGKKLRRRFVLADGMVQLFEPGKSKAPTQIKIGSVLQVITSTTAGSSVFVVGVEDDFYSNFQFECSDGSDRSKLVDAISLAYSTVTGTMLSILPMEGSLIDSLLMSKAYKMGDGIGARMSRADSGLVAERGRALTPQFLSQTLGRSLTVGRQSEAGAAARTARGISNAILGKAGRGLTTAMMKNFMPNGATPDLFVEEGLSHLISNTPVSAEILHSYMHRTVDAFLNTAGSDASAGRLQKVCAQPG